MSDTIIRVRSHAREQYIFPTSPLSPSRRPLGRLEGRKPSPPPPSPPPPTLSSPPPEAAAGFARGAADEGGGGASPAALHHSRGASGPGATAPAGLAPPDPRRMVAQVRAGAPRPCGRRGTRWMRARAWRRRLRLRGSRSGRPPPSSADSQVLPPDLAGSVLDVGSSPGGSGDRKIARRNP